MAGRPDAFDRVLRLLRRGLQELVEEVVPLDVGFVARTRSLPNVWTLNQLCVTAPADPAEVLSLAELHQRDLAFRHVVVEHDQTAEALERAVATQGWTVARLVYMLLGPEPAPLEAAPAAPCTPPHELTEDETLLLMRRWLEEEREGASAEELDQVVEYNRRERRRWNEIAYGVRDAGGRPVAVTKLRHEGSFWWVEDVYTAPEARRRGFARALVTHAAATARAAGPDAVLVIADADDWPRHLYASIGFREVGTVHSFHRDAGG